MLNRNTLRANSQKVLITTCIVLHVVPYRIVLYFIVPRTTVRHGAETVTICYQTLADDDQCVEWSHCHADSDLHA
jgi:hypothetical protein